jgi:hypothetical protein
VDPNLEGIMMIVSEKFNLKAPLNL